MPINLSVVIPTQGHKKKLETCLSSLARQTLKKANFEVLLCFNNVVDFSLNSWVDEYGSNIRKIEVREGGVNVARNSGIEHSKGELVFFLDDDCELKENTYLQRLLGEFESVGGQKKRLDGLGGFYEAPFGANAFERIYNKNSRTWIESCVYHGNRSLFLLGGNFVVHRRVIEQDCRFDELVGWGGSELSFFIAAAKKEFVFEYRKSFSVEHHCSLGLLTFVKKLQKQFFQSRDYFEKGLMPRRSLVEPKLEGVREVLVMVVMRIIFYPDKLWAIATLCFFPFRILPRKAINNLFDLFTRYRYLYHFKKNITFKIANKNIKRD